MDDEGPAPPWISDRASGTDRDFEELVQLSTSELVTFFVQEFSAGARESVSIVHKALNHK